MITVPDQIISRFVTGRYDHYLGYLFSQLKTIMLDTVSDVLPVDLTVAGAVLVVFLGWRLFRNFTRG